MSIKRLANYLTTLEEAASISHGNGNFLQHLLGVYHILRSWKCSETIHLAGLFHSVYGTEFFREKLFDIKQRNKLQDLIGKEAEQLVYYFCVLNRQDIKNAFEHINSNDKHLLVKQHASHEISIPVHSARQLLSIEMANIIEQISVNDRSPTLVFARLHELSTYAEELCEDHPLKMLQEFTYEQEIAALYLYKKALSEKHECAAALLSKFVEINPMTAEGYILLSSLELDKSNYSEAISLASHASYILSLWGTAWDKRIELANWLALSEKIIKLSSIQAVDIDLWSRIKNILQPTKS